MIDNDLTHRSMACLERITSRRSADTSEVSRSSSLELESERKIPEMATRDLHASLLGWKMETPKIALWDGGEFGFIFGPGDRSGKQRATKHPSEAKACDRWIVACIDCINGSHGTFGNVAMRATPTTISFHALQMQSQTFGIFFFSIPRDRSGALPGNRSFNRI